MEELSVNQKKAIKTNRLKFIGLCKEINMHLKDEELSLNFLGYTETLLDYINVTNTDLDGLKALILDTNLWSDYMGELEGFIELRMLRFENKMLYLEGFTVKNIPNPDLEKEITLNKRKYLLFKLFLKHLYNQKRLFEKAHKICLKLYNEALNNYKYKYND